MKKSVLRSTDRWEPIKRSEATHRGLTVEPWPPHHPKDFGLVLDRSVWFEMSLAPRWRVSFRLVDGRGQPVIAEARIFPEEPGPYPPGRWSGEYGAPTKVPPGGLGTRVLRQIRTQAFRTALRSIMTHKITMDKGKRSEGVWGKEEWESVFPGVPLSTVPHSATSGRKGRSDIELARIAAIYEAAYLSARPSTAAVAKATKLSLTKVRDAIRRARVRRLLSPASKRGKGGGLLTPLARKILKLDAKRKGGKRHGTKR